MTDVALPPTEGTAQHIARSASILAMGSMASRALGLIRETLIAHYFGAVGPVSAFRLASRVPFMVYDLLIGGMLTAALVPVLSDYARPERRRELWPAASAILSVLAALLAAIVLVLEAFAPLVAWLLGGGFDPSLLAILIRSLRILAPAVWLFGIAGVLMGLLYALQRFTFPALGAPIFNLGIILSVLLLAGRLDVYSLSWGVFLGALGQVLILLPGLKDARLRPRFDWRNPALRRIAQLYLPVAAGLVISQIQVVIDGNLASRTGPNSVAWMQNATTLIQFPHGLIGVAISIASLPSLSQWAARGDWETYRETLARALCLVLYLIVPATIGLWVLGRPIVRLIFEHGAFTSADTTAVVMALRLYLIGLIFATVDWPLNYAFYAQQDTTTPAAVGVLSVGVYLVVALALLKPWGYLGLVFADSAKHMAHAATMMILLWRRVGGIDARRIASTALRAAVFSAAMAVTAFAVAHGVERVLSDAQRLADLFIVIGAGGVAVAVYGLGTWAAGMEEAKLVGGLLAQRLSRRRGPEAVQ
ncbi:MAG: murein biosynthesis integral membrane protein MurJ [Anaerolineae bacterium]